MFTICGCSFRFAQGISDNAASHVLIPNEAWIKWRLAASTSAGIELAHLLDYRIIKILDDLANRLIFVVMTVDIHNRKCRIVTRVTLPSCICEQLGRIEFFNLLFVKVARRKFHYALLSY